MIPIFLVSNKTVSRYVDILGSTFRIHAGSGGWSTSPSSRTLCMCCTRSRRTRAFWVSCRVRSTVKGAHKGRPYMPHDETPSPPENRKGGRPVHAPLPRGHSGPARHSGGSRLRKRPGATREYQRDPQGPRGVLGSGGLEVWETEVRHLVVHQRGQTEQLVRLGADRRNTLFPSVAPTAVLEICSLMNLTRHEQPGGLSRGHPFGRRCLAEVCAPVDAPAVPATERFSLRIVRPKRLLHAVDRRPRIDKISISERRTAIASPYEPRGALKSRYRCKGSRARQAGYARL